MSIFDRFKRRNDTDMSKKTKFRNQPVHKVEEVKVEEVAGVITPEGLSEEVKVEMVESEYNQIDLAVAKHMGTYDGTAAPKPYSTNRELVNEMVAFARANKIKLPLFTADPTKIATAISEWEGK